MLVVAGFVVTVLLLLLHINPPAQAAKESIEPPGNVMVAIRWPDELDIDVDLWVQASGDRATGYSNKGGTVINLLRDDRGHLRDVSNLNYEVSYSRGVPVGEYVVNLHLYATPIEIPQPFAVDVVVSVKRLERSSSRQVVAGKAMLRRKGKEITVFRLELDENAELVQNSVLNVFMPLRAEKS